MAVEFGKNLRVVRRVRNISQKELSEQLEVSQSVISQWESGEISPSVENLIKLCEILDCSADLLLGIDKKED